AVALECADTVGSRHTLRGGKIDVYHPDEIDPPQFRQCQHMILPHVSDADDGAANAALGGRRGGAHYSPPPSSSMPLVPAGTMPRREASMNSTNRPTRGWSPSSALTRDTAVLGASPDR